MHVGITGFGTWLPSGRVTAADLAAATGIPESVIALKFGVKGKPVAGPGETTAFMGLAAARKALASAGIEGGEGPSLRDESSLNSFSSVRAGPQGPIFK